MDVGRRPRARRLTCLQAMRLGPTVVRSGDAAVHARRGSSVEVPLPVRGDAAGRTRRGLTKRVVLRRRQLGPVVVLLILVVPEPVLTRLETPDDPVPTLAGVRAGVLARRTVAAADVPARGAAAQVEPPPVRRVAFDAP